MVGGSSWNCWAGFSKGHLQLNRIISNTSDRTVEGIINRCVVTGVEYEGLIIGGPGIGEASAGNPFVPSPPDFVSEAINDQLIEDNTTALAVARRIVADKNRRPERITVESVFNPRLVPASVVTIVAPSLSLNGRYLIDTVRHSIAGASARTTITTLGGALVNAETNLAPVASFLVQFVQEARPFGVVHLVLLHAASSRLVLSCPAIECSQMSTERRSMPLSPHARHTPHVVLCPRSAEAGHENSCPCTGRSPAAPTRNVRQPCVCASAASDSVCTDAMCEVLNHGAVRQPWV